MNIKFAWLVSGTRHLKSQIPSLRSVAYRCLTYSCPTTQQQSKIQNLKFQIDFVGIGASKSGTTWLGHALEEHPQLCMAEPKEVNYFNEIHAFRTSVKPNFHRGINWYRKFFNHCSSGQLKGEITNYYGIDPLAAARIKEHNPDSKILFCMRNPVDRIWSHYQFAKFFERKENRPIEQAVHEEPQYLRMSDYFQTLSLYHQHFSRDQIFLIWFEDIQNRPAELLHEVFLFLKVDPAFQPKKIHKKSNPARVSRSAALQKIIRHIKLALIGLGLSGLLKKIKMAGLGDFVMKMSSRTLPKTPIPGEIKNYILSEFHEDIIKLEKLTGKDLSHWRM
ncbi:MAG: sulfotransferase domain-containing protein [Saprospiraceae bacterium]